MQSLLSNNGIPLSVENKVKLIKEFVNSISRQVKKILLIPPDITRRHSGIGLLTSILYKNLRAKDFKSIEILPALGTHDPMNGKELIKMFGEGIPLSLFHTHDWRNETREIGIVPREYVSKISSNKFSKNIKIEINRLIMDNYDLIISLGQVLPHEMVGMANYNKNIFVGCGGEEIINKSHYIGAISNLEYCMGRDYTPPLQVFDYAAEHFLSNIPIVYVLTVNSTDINPDGEFTDTLGIYIGKDRSVFEEAVKLSQQVNIIKLKQGVRKMIVYLDEEEFKSTWLGCKAIYRTRMALAEGSELILIGPGLKSFGEDKEFDNLIRKYGYIGVDKIIKAVAENEDLQNNLAAAAHLITASSEGRFKIKVASRFLSQQELEGVNYEYLTLDEVYTNYTPDKLRTGSHHINGEEVFYVDNPATGLWTTIDKFDN